MDRKIPNIFADYDRSIRTWYEIGNAMRTNLVRGITFEVYMDCLEEPDCQGSELPFVHASELQRGTTSLSTDFFAGSKNFHRKTMRSGSVLFV